MKQLISGAEFLNFETQPRFIGTYTGPCKREKDSDEKDKNGDPVHRAGDVMGYYFEGENGKEVIIGNSHSVNKAIEQIKPGDVLGFTFLGKGVTGKNQPFNRFDIKLFESVEEAVKYYQTEALA